MSNPPDLAAEAAARLRHQVDEFHRTADEIFANQLREFDRIFGLIPKQESPKEGLPLPSRLGARQ